jgi:hypothetical protein
VGCGVVGGVWFDEADEEEDEEEEEEEDEEACVGGTKELRSSRSSGSLSDRRSGVSPGRSRG